MVTSATKWFILPFSAQKNREPFGSEVEAAAIFALAEFERNKGGGIISRQPEEKITSLSKIGYPIWLFPKNNATFIFDGFSDSNKSIPYTEIPSTKVFIEKLEANSRPLEKYTSFLLYNVNYFQQATKRKKIVFRGLIVDSDFKREFNVYRREAVETTAETNSALLSPILEETVISSNIAKFDKVQSFLREELEKLQECVRIINKITSQYITELDYEAAAIKEEAAAKIKAQEELINPQIAQLYKDYNRKIKNLAESFDKEIENLQKLNVKILKFIEGDTEKINLFQSEAKAQAIKKHEIYEKRLKKKIKQIKKELNALKKEQKNIQNNLKKLNKKKVNETANLNFELDAEIKLARQPLSALQAIRDSKILTLKQESDKLIKKEKSVIESLNKSLKIEENIQANFEVLSIKAQGLNNHALFFVPFYVACYEMGLKKRYIVFPPSNIGTVDFSAKFKGALGISKIKDLLITRYKAITILITNVQVLSKQNSEVENLIRNLSERNNLLKNSLFLENVEKGLVLLSHEGWLSDREHQVLRRHLTG